MSEYRGDAEQILEDVLEHYGREGMHWYRHIYGEADSRAKYKMPATSKGATQKMEIGGGVSEDKDIDTFNSEKSAQEWAEKQAEEWFKNHKSSNMTVFYVKVGDHYMEYKVERNKEGEGFKYTPRDLTAESPEYKAKMAKQEAERAAASEKAKQEAAKKAAAAKAEEKKKSSSKKSSSSSKKKTDEEKAEEEKKKEEAAKKAEEEKKKEEEAKTAEDAKKDGTTNPDDPSVHTDPRPEGMKTVQEYREKFEAEEAKKNQPTQTQEQPKKTETKPKTTQTTKTKTQSTTKSTKSTSSGGSGAVSTTSTRTSPVKDGPVNKRGYAEVEIGSDTEKKKKKVVHSGITSKQRKMEAARRAIERFLDEYDD